MDWISDFIVSLVGYAQLTWFIAAQVLVTVAYLYVVGLVLHLFFSAICGDGWSKWMSYVRAYHAFLRKVYRCIRWVVLLPWTLVKKLITIVHWWKHSTMRATLANCYTMVLFILSFGRWGRTYPKEGAAWLIVGWWLWREASLKFSPHTGAKIAHASYLSRKRMMTHGCLIGATESGKTTVMEQMLLELIFSKNKPNLLITDPKGVLHKRLLIPLLKNGYEVQVLDSRNIARSARYNLLHFVEDKPGSIRALLKMLKKSGDVAEAKDDNWMAWGYDHCTFFVRLVLRMRGHMDSAFIGLHEALHLIKMSQANEAYISTLVATYGDQRMAIDWAEFQSKNDGLKAGIVSNAKGILAMFEDEQICQLLSTDTSLDLTAINNTKDQAPSCIIGAMDENDMERLGFAMTHINKQAIVERTRNKPGKRAREAYFFFEELTQLPVLDGLAKAVSYVRQFKLGLVMIVQSRNLFMDLYGQATVKAIEDNIGWQAYCAVSPNDAESVERRLGYAVTKEGSKPLMLRQKLEQMGQGKLLLFQRQKRPALLNRFAHTNRKYRWKPYKKLDVWEAMAGQTSQGETSVPEPKYLYPDEPQTVDVSPYDSDGVRIEVDQTEPKMDAEPEVKPAMTTPPASLEDLIAELRAEQ